MARIVSVLDSGCVHIERQRKCEGRCVSRHSGSTTLWSSRRNVSFYPIKSTMKSILQTLVVGLCGFLKFYTEVPLRVTLETLIDV